MKNAQKKTPDCMIRAAAKYRKSKYCPTIYLPLWAKAEVEYRASECGFSVNEYIGTLIRYDLDNKVCPKRGEPCGNGWPK